MYELKEDIILFIGCFISCCVILFATDCRSVPGPSGDLGRTNTYIAGKLEASVEAFDRGVRAAIVRSRGIEDDVERLVKLFGEYEQAALGLRDEVERLRREVEMAQEAGGYGGGIGVPVRGGEGGDADSPPQGNTPSRDN